MIKTPIIGKCKHVKIYEMEICSSLDLLWDLQISTWNIHDKVKNFSFRFVSHTFTAWMKIHICAKSDMWSRKV
jgi:hypothetical protein